MKIYIASSWKNRLQVRNIAIILRGSGHKVYDFTDPSCRKHLIPPEKYPEQFDPSQHLYSVYINKGDWREAVAENRAAIEWCDCILLILPCGIDSHADWALGVGMGKKSVIVGHPRKGERSPVHLWADAILDSEIPLLDWLRLHDCTKEPDDRKL